MKKVFLGVTLCAAAGITLAYLTKVAYEKGYFDSISDDLHEFAFKTKKKIKNAVDTGKNEIEYRKSQAEYEIGKRKRKHAALTEE